MQVFHTNLFKKQFSSESLMLKFIDNFKQWKLSENENSSKLFGRDTGYREPKLDNGGYIMHVHVIPSNKAARDKWEKAHDTNSVKRSDSALVYVKKNTDYLILFWIKNEAHITADQNKNLMESFRRIGQHWIDTGEIVENKKI